MISYYNGLATKLDVKHFVTYAGESELVLKNIVSTYLWSPIIWVDSVRLEDNFISCEYAVLDFEDPFVSIESIERLYCDAWRIIGPTIHHRIIKKKKSGAESPPMDRFRAVFKWERPITDIWEYRHNIFHLSNNLNADLKCKDGARQFRPCSSIYSCDMSSDMALLEVLPVPEESPSRIAKALKTEKFYKSCGTLPPFASRCLNSVIPTGDRNSACMKLGCQFYRAGIEYEDGIRRILASPTYAGSSIDNDLLKEIREAVLSGYKRARNDSVDVRG